MFSIKKLDTGLSAPFDYLPGTAAEAIVAGEALVLTAGKLTKCGATAAPAYVSVGPVNTDGIVPVVKVQPYMEFATTLSAAGTALNLGDKVTLSADGLQVTATTTSGVATITRMDDTAVGGAVCVRF